MESLALPKDLLWTGKVEPTSPPSSELFPLTESFGEWLIDDDNIATDLILPLANDLDTKTGLEILESTEIFNNNDLIIKFDEVKEDQWNETKSNSIQYLDYNTLETVIEQPSIITKVQNPYILSDNNATGYDATILTQLTPPQSPPRQGIPSSSSIPTARSNSISLHDVHNVKEILDFIVQQTTDSSSSIATSSQLSQLHLSIASPNSSSTDNDINSPQSIFDCYSDVTTPAPAATVWNNGNGITVPVPSNFQPFQSEIERETQIVDEIVKTRAKELLDWNDDCESMSSLSPRSTDEDWTPTSPSNISSCNESTIDYGCGDVGGKCLSAQRLSKKRTRPYGRCPEDRKSRKKEQNKNAATRYRQKKKQEMESVLSEEQILTQRNEELKKVLADRKREAKYLKTLIREFYEKNKSK